MLNKEVDCWKVRSLASLCITEFHIFSETFFSQRCRLLIISPYHHQNTPSWWVHYRLFSRAYPPSVVT